jgi:hypothetical protein
LGLLPLRRTRPGRPRLFIGGIENRRIDTLQIILRRGPSGETIVDTLLSNRGARRDLAAKAVVDVLMELTREVRALARETPRPHTAPIEKLTKGVELLAALVLANSGESVERYLIRSRELRNIHVNARALTGQLRV